MWITQSRLLAALPTIQHGFFGRTGGVSAGEYASLNAGLGSQDDAACVTENRRRIAAALGASAGPITLRQVHGATVCAVNAPLPDDARPEADGILTTTPGLAIGVLTADCVPILLADAAAGVVAAVHAGWKGVQANIPEAAIAQMEQRGAQRHRIVAAIGPCIAQVSYEVGDELRTAFADIDPAFAAYFAPNTSGKWQFDVGGAAALRLQRAGIEQMERLGCDTYALEARFFSYRRTTHRAKGGPIPDYGRQISGIALREPRSRTR